MRSRQLQQFMLLIGLCGLLTVSAQFACSDDNCSAARQGAFTSLDELNQNRIEAFGEALARQGVVLADAQRESLARDGQLLGAIKLDRPIKHPNGTIEMPDGWLPEIPEGHPWAKPLTPADDAFFSWFEERIVDARLFDPTNGLHVEWANAYLAKVTAGGNFMGWSYATGTSCPTK